MPSFKDKEIQRLIKDVESRPELLDLTLTTLIKKCPYLVEAYNLRKEDDPKSKVTFQSFWYRLRKELAGKLDQENNAATQRPDPPQASLPLVAMPSMPGNQMVENRTPRHSSPPAVHNLQQLHQHYHAPGVPLPVQQSVVYNSYIMSDNAQINNAYAARTTENHPPDADSLANDIAERVTETLGPKIETLGPKIDSIAPTVVKTIKKQAPPSSTKGFAGGHSGTSLNSPIIGKELFSNHDDSPRGDKNYLADLFKKQEDSKDSFKEWRERRRQDIKNERDFEFPISLRGVAIEDLLNRTDCVLVFGKALLYVTQNTSNSKFDDYEGTGCMGCFHSAGTTALGLNVIESVTLEDEDEEGEEIIISFAIAAPELHDMYKARSILLNWAATKNCAEIVIESSVSEGTTFVGFDPNSLKQLVKNRYATKLTLQRASLSNVQLDALLPEEGPSLLLYKFVNCAFQDDGLSLLVQYPESVKPGLKLEFSGWYPCIGKLLQAVRAEGRLSSLSFDDIRIAKKDMNDFRKLCREAKRQGWEVHLDEYVRCEDNSNVDVRNFFLQEEYSTIELFLGHLKAAKRVESMATTTAFVDERMSSLAHHNMNQEEASKENVSRAKAASSAQSKQKVVASGPLRRSTRMRKPVKK